MTTFEPVRACTQVVRSGLRSGSEREIEKKIAHFMGKIGNFGESVYYIPTPAVVLSPNEL